MSVEQSPNQQPQADNQKDPAGTRPKYEAPKVTPMSEKDVLKSFQVTSAANTWWAM